MSDVVLFNQAQGADALVMSQGAPGVKGDPGSPGEGYATRTAMAARLAPALLDDVYLTEAGREGKFVVDAASSWTAQIAADTAQGIFIISTADATKVYRRVGGAETPQMFGAGGAGTTEDGATLAAFSALINARGGGVITLQPGSVYSVGSTTLHNPSVDQFGAPGGLYRFYPNTVYPLEISGCTKGVVINGNGASIKAKASAKYGTFNLDGTVMASALGYSGDGIGVPYFAMLRIYNNSGSVHVSDIEFDGNIQNALLGGYHAADSSGRQIPMSGIHVYDNTGSVVVENCKFHHHGLDGGIGNGLGDRAVKEQVNFRNCGFLSNGRQGFSLVGGNGWEFDDCKFNKTGKDIGSMTPSAPAAGFDIEGESGRYAINTKFFNCEFSDNYFAGMVSDASSYALEADFYGCTFIGTTSWAIWANRPGFRFHDCTFAGASVGLYASATNPGDANQFERCTFTDDLSLSPTGTLYNVGFFDMSSYGGAGINFDKCIFHKTLSGDVSFGNGADTAALLGPWYNDCVFKADDALTGYFRPVGIYTGPLTTFINVSNFPGDSLVAVYPNEGISLDNFTWAGARYAPSHDRATMKRVYYGSATYDPPSLAAGAKDTAHTMTVTGVVLSDTIEDVSFSLDLAGARIHAWVSAANTVSYYAINENGANPLDLASGTVRVKVRKS